MLECTHHSVHVTQPYTGTTADNQLAPRQNYILPGDGTHGKIDLAVNVLIVNKFVGKYCYCWSGFRKHTLSCHRMRPALFQVLCEIKEKTGTVQWWHIFLILSEFNCLIDYSSLVACIVQCIILLVLLLLSFLLLLGLLLQVDLIKQVSMSVRPSVHQSIKIRLLDCLKLMEGKGEQQLQMYYKQNMLFAL